VIDLHSHILPGLDDGAKTIEDSLDIARTCAQQGVTMIAATPHVRDDYPTTPQLMEERLDQVRRALASHQIAVEVRGGGEIAIERIDRLPDAELRRFGLAGNPDYLLIEFPYFGWPLALSEHVFDLATRGLTPVIAHPERNAEVQLSPERLETLVEMGALVQVTAASLDGRLGRQARKAAVRLVEVGLAHLLASDAHGREIRDAGLAAAADAIGDRLLARWLTHDVPHAIAARTPIPPRPEQCVRGWRRFSA
jgi:protein-tyrosine phosphatase